VVLEQAGSGGKHGRDLEHEVGQVLRHGDQPQGRSGDGRAGEHPPAASPQHQQAQGRLQQLDRHAGAERHARPPAIALHPPQQPDPAQGEQHQVDLPLVDVCGHRLERDGHEHEQDCRLPASNAQRAKRGDQEHDHRELKHCQHHDQLCRGACMQERLQHPGHGQRRHVLGTRNRQPGGR